MNLTYVVDGHVALLRALLCMLKGKDNFPSCEVLMALHEIIAIVVIDEYSSPMMIELQRSEARCPHRRRPRANANPIEGDDVAVSPTPA
jgi:hypothetical protein